MCECLCDRDVSAGPFSEARSEIVVSRLLARKLSRPLNKYSCSPHGQQYVGKEGANVSVLKTLEEFASFSGNLFITGRAKQQQQKKNCLIESCLIERNVK